jgi:hypothetical protein
VAISASAPRIGDLSETDRGGLVGAAVWYAKYHEGMIAGLADDRSARAAAERERYQELYDALAKLGVRLHRPTGIRPAA